MIAGTYVSVIPSLSDVPFGDLAGPRRKKKRKKKKRKIDAPAEDEP